MENKISTKHCRSCDREKPINEMCIGKLLCKKCHCVNEKKRRDSWSDEERKIQYKRIHKLAKDAKHKLSLSSDTLKKINFWIKNIFQRARESKQFESRKTISEEILREKCLESLKKFPEINFCFIAGSGSLRADMASLDRIDCSKPYSDENIQIIPLWLNSAKLDLTEEELCDKIINFSLNNEYIRNKLRPYFGGKDTL